MNKYIGAFLLVASLLPSLTFALTPTASWTANFPYSTSCDSQDLQGYGNVTYGTATDLHLYINGVDYPLVYKQGGNGTMWSVDNSNLTYNVNTGASNQDAFKLTTGNNTIDLKLVDASGTTVDEFLKNYPVPACVVAQGAQNDTQTAQGASQTINTTQNTTPVQNTAPASNSPQNVQSSGVSQSNPVITQDDTVLDQELEQLIQVLTLYLQALLAQQHAAGN